MQIHANSRKSHFTVSFDSAEMLTMFNAMMKRAKSMSEQLFEMTLCRNTCIESLQVNASSTILLLVHQL